MIVVARYDAAIMALDDFPAYGQSQASAASTGFGFAGLHKLVEHTTEFVFRDTNTFIDHSEDQRFHTARIEAGPGIRLGSEPAALRSWKLSDDRSTFQEEPISSPPT